MGIWAYYVMYSVLQQPLNTKVQAWLLLYQPTFSKFIFTLIKITRQVSPNARKENDRGCHPFKVTLVDNDNGEEFEVISSKQT